MLVWHSATTVSTAHFLLIEKLYAVYSMAFASVRIIGVEGSTGAVEEALLLSLRSMVSYAEEPASFVRVPLDSTLPSLGWRTADMVGIYLKSVSKYRAFDLKHMTYIVLGSGICVECACFWKAVKLTS